MMSEGTVPERHITMLTGPALIWMFLAILCILRPEVDQPRQDPPPTRLDLVFIRRLGRSRREDEPPDRPAERLDAFHHERLGPFENGSRVHIVIEQFRHTLTGRNGVGQRRSVIHVQANSS
jgi:hypothetical protein